MDIRAYLERIGYGGWLEPDLSTLAALHRAHLFAVPFENLDIHMGREIVLDEERLFAKIVEERRGGFCYELNGLFAALLRRLGFRVTLLSAGVARADGGFGPEFDHLTLRVDLEKPYLADVGFGECFLEPLAFDEVSPDGYRLSMAGAHSTLFRAEKPEYRFMPAAQELADFKAMCRYHQTSPESFFTRGRLITLPSAKGRLTLTDARFIVTDGGERQEQLVSGPDEFRMLYEKYFRI